MLKLTASIVLISSMALLGLQSSAQAQETACVTDGTTAVCTDSAGNVGVSTIESDGTQTTVGIGADGSTVIISE
jgi:hypothetical protein